MDRYTLFNRFKDLSFDINSLGSFFQNELNFEKNEKILEKIKRIRIFKKTRKFIF